MSQEKWSDINGSGENYRAFLLRCWQEQTSGEPAWRFTMVQLGEKGAKRGFASLEDLMAHLRCELAERNRTPARTDSSE